MGTKRHMAANRRDVLKGLGALTAFAAAGELTPASAQTATPASAQGPDTVYELRVYHLHPGKLPLILERFRSRETALFARCGMTGIAYWTPVEDSGEIKAGETLVYMLRHASREQARQLEPVFTRLGVGGAQGRNGKRRAFCGEGRFDVPQADGLFAEGIGIVSVHVGRGGTKIQGSLRYGALRLRSR